MTDPWLESRRTRAPPYGSSTQTVTGAFPREAGDDQARAPDAGSSRPSHDAGGGGRDAGRLVLRGGPTRRQRVQWEEGTVDNEGMGKKKSKSASQLRSSPPVELPSDGKQQSAASTANHARLTSRPTKATPIRTLPATRIPMSTEATLGVGTVDGDPARLGMAM